MTSSRQSGKSKLTDWENFGRVAKWFLIGSTRVHRFGNSIQPGSLGTRTRKRDSNFLCRL